MAGCLQRKPRKTSKRRGHRDHGPGTARLSHVLREERICRVAVEVSLEEIGLLI